MLHFALCIFLLSTPSGGESLVDFLAVAVLVEPFSAVGLGCPFFTTQPFTRTTFSSYNITQPVA